MTLPSWTELERTCRLPAQYMSARENPNINVVGFPRIGDHEDSLREIANMGVQAIVGNSANIARRMFGEELAAKTNATYIHADIKTSVDELTAEKYLEQFPKGFDTLEGIVYYQKLTALSKFSRIYGLSNKSLDMMGFTQDYAPKNTIVYMTDSISIAGGYAVEKPKNKQEAWDQINKIIEGQPYLISSVNIALWADQVRGIAANVHVLPVMLDPEMSASEREELRNVWFHLYESGQVPLTPCAVSQANPEIYPHMYVGLMPHFSDHVMPTTRVSNRLEMQQNLRWVPTTTLPKVVADEVWTTMTGSPPTGLAMVINGLVRDTERKKNSYKLIDRDLILAGHMVGARIPDQFPLDVFFNDDIL